MAGDWIKMRSNLHEHPKVATISQKLELDELHVVGMLWRIWSWADQHSRDGHGISVTLVTVDRLARHDGFGQAMADVGWLEVSDTGITLPHFAKHNGHTAKERVLAAERKATQRARDQQGHGGVTEESRPVRDNPVTTEENRREQKSIETKTVDGGEKAEKKPTQAEQIYALYPRKEAKAAALKAIAVALKKVPAERLIDRVTTYAAAVNRWPAERRQFIPLPASWFNAGRWDDDPAQWEDRSAPKRPMLPEKKPFTIASLLEGMDRKPSTP